MGWQKILGYSVWRKWSHGFWGAKYTKDWRMNNRKKWEVKVDVEMWDVNVVITPLGERVRVRLQGYMWVFFLHGKMKSGQLDYNVNKAGYLLKPMHFLLSYGRQILIFFMKIIIASLYLFIIYSSPFIIFGWSLIKSFIFFCKIHQNFQVKNLKNQLHYCPSI